MTNKNKSYPSIKPGSILQKDIVYLFGVVRTTVQDWVKNGCPYDKDNRRYDLKEVIQWREEYVKNYTRNDEEEDDRNELEKDRLRGVIKKYEIDNAEKQKKTITRERFEQIQREQGSSLKVFVTDGFKRNSQEMMNRLGIPADRITEFNEVIEYFIKSMMDAFVSRGKDI